MHNVSHERQGDGAQSCGRTVSERFVYEVKVGVVCSIAKSYACIALIDCVIENNEKRNLEQFAGNWIETSHYNFVSRDVALNANPLSD